MITLYLATGNPHKVEEFSALFDSENLPVRVGGAAEIGGMPQVAETELTFEGNAILKARSLVPRLKEGDYALADDSGLEVDALDGKPGVFSSRFAGDEATDGLNLAKLLILLSTVQEGRRGAQFACSLVLMNHRGSHLCFSALCRGRIAPEARGINGFGYDPAFIPDGYDRTFGELNWSVKSKISHRAKALSQLVDWLKGRTGPVP